VPVSTINLNSYLELRKSKINIIDLKRQLRDYINMIQLEDFKKFNLQRRENMRGLMTNSVSNAFLPRDPPSPSCIMSSPNLGFALLGTHITPEKKLRFPTISGVDTRSDQSLPNCTPTNSIDLGEGVLGYATEIRLNDFPVRQVQTEKLSSCTPLTRHEPLTPTKPIDNDTYNGFVYNLSVVDDESYLIGKSKMIVHNCVCEWELIWEPER